MIIAYDKAKGCTGKVPPGMRNLYRWTLATVPYAKGLGTLNCRKVRESAKTWSLHSEGRAMDITFTKDVSENCRKLAEYFSQPEIAEKYQIQGVIDYQRNRAWFGKVGAWKSYKGKGYKHVHVEMNWKGANNNVALATVDIPDSEIEYASADEDDGFPYDDYDNPIMLASIFVAMVCLGFFTIEIFSS